MAWTIITNAAVAAGAALTTGLMTALRDNFSALAAGDTDAPAIRAKAKAIEAIYTGEGERSGSGTVTFFSKTDFTDIGMLRYDVMASMRSSTAGGGINSQIEVRVSDDGGTTWSSWIGLTPTWGPVNNDDATVAVATGYINMRDGAITGVSTCPSATNTGARDTVNTSFDPNLNAIQFRLDVNGVAGTVASGSAMLYPIAGLKTT